MSEKESTTILIRRGFVDLPEGQIHYRTAGEGKKSVLMLHQTPRSSDEFLEVIPFFASNYRVIAMDAIGYGDSYKPKTQPTITDYADAAISLLDGLGISKFYAVGHHTGAVIAFDLAVNHPSRVERLVLSNSPYLDEVKRGIIVKRPPIDLFEVTDDGTLLAEIWNRRRSFYPKNRPDLLFRYFIDVMKAGEGLEAGHKAVSKYDMEGKIDKIDCPTLLVCGMDDPYSFPDLEKLHSRIARSIAVPVPEGMVCMVDQMPEKFSEIVLKFLLFVGG